MSDVPVVPGTALPSSIEGVTAWLSGISTTPDGAAFSIVARISARGVRYYPKAAITIDGVTTDVGGSTSAGTWESRSLFVHQGDIAGKEVTLAIFEATEMGQTDPKLVATLHVAS